MNVRTRRATLDDIPWMLGELRNFSDFYQTKRRLFADQEHVTTILTNLITNHFVCIAEKESSPMGFIVGMVSGHVFNPTIRTLTELAWWVEEKSRMSRAGLMLLNEFISFGKENADWINFSLEAHSPVKGDCLEKRGFSLKERNFILEV
jgi:hypothetical protein